MIQMKKKLDFLTIHSKPHISLIVCPPFHLLSRVVLVSQSCPTLCDPIDCNLPGSSVLGILQARILEWLSFSKRRSHFLLQQIFPTWRSNPGGLNGREILYSLSYRNSNLIMCIKRRFSFRAYVTSSPRREEPQGFKWPF